MRTATILAAAIVISILFSVDAEAQRARTDRGKRVDRSEDRRVERPKATTKKRRAKHRVSKRSDRRMGARYNKRGNHSKKGHGYYKKKGHGYYKRHGGSRSNVSIHLAWPWVIKAKPRWRPHIRYRQVIRIGSPSRIEFETVYRHRIVHADNRYAILDIEIDEILLYRDGRYLGRVDRIPRHLATMEATVDRAGRVTFDRDVFLVGDARAGFELISAPSHADRYRFEVGRLDLRREHVRSVSRSRLFDPRDSRGFVPMSLVPEDAEWLWEAEAAIR